MHETLPEHNLAEVLVRRQQHRATLVGPSQDLFVSKARRQLGHVDDVMSVQAWTVDHRAVDAFIGDQVHADRVETG